MVHCCAVYGCKNRANPGNGIRFFRFPSVNGLNLERRELMERRRNLWFKALNRTDISETQLSTRKICSIHFISGTPAVFDDVDNPDWVPSVALYNGIKMALTRKLPSRRVVRQEKKDVPKIDGIKSINTGSIDIERIDNDSINTEIIEVETVFSGDSVVMTSNVETQTDIIFEGNIVEKFHDAIKEIDELKKENAMLRSIVDVEILKINELKEENAMLKSIVDENLKEQENKNNRSEKTKFYFTVD